MASLTSDKSKSKAKNKCKNTRKSKRNFKNKSHQKEGGWAKEEVKKKPEGIIDTAKLFSF